MMSRGKLARRFRVSCESYGDMRIWSKAPSDSEVRVAVEVFESGDVSEVISPRELRRRLEAVLGSIGPVAHESPLAYAGAVSDGLRKLSVDVGVVQVEVHPGVWVTHLLVPAVAEERLTNPITGEVS